MDRRIVERRTYTNHQKQLIIHSNEEHNQNKEQAENKAENDQAHAYPSPNLGLLGRRQGPLNIARGIFSVHLTGKDNGDDSKGKINPRTTQKTKDGRKDCQNQVVGGAGGCCCLAKYSSIF